MSNNDPTIKPRMATPQLRKMIKPAKAKMNLYKIENLKKAGPKSRSKLKILTFNST
jgi:hypothetical protein